jgi:hypothetical protein
MNTAVVKLAELYHSLAVQSDANTMAKFACIPVSIMKVYRQVDWNSR